MSRKLFLFFGALFVGFAFAHAQETRIEYCIAHADNAENLEQAATWYYRAVLRMMQDNTCIDESLDDSIKAFIYNLFGRIGKTHASKAEQRSGFNSSAIFEAQKQWLRDVTLQQQLPSQVDPFMERIRAGSLYSNVWRATSQFLDSMNVDRPTEKQKRQELAKICRARRIEFVTSKL